MILARIFCCGTIEKATPENPFYPGDYAVTVTAVLGLRAAFYEQLHCRYQRHAFYNRLVWGGNETIETDGTTLWTDLSERLYRARQDVGSGLGWLSALHRRHRRKRRPGGGRQRAIVD